MRRYLAALSLGPVQSLIGAARRTRDLWCGSWLLSESARAAARVLHAHEPGCLIFPTLENPETDLSPADLLGAATVANVLRAEVTAADAAAVRRLCLAAKQAAFAFLAGQGEAVRHKLRGVRAEAWAAQIGETLEGSVAWVEVGDGPDAYRDASERLGALLAARKLTRVFRASPALSVAGLPKSSLDGALETVLDDPLPAPTQRLLGLSTREQLDALGVIKRMAGNSEQFTAYARIAADPWIMQLTADQLSRLAPAYEKLVPYERATRVRGNAGIYGALPYDAQMLYSFRLQGALSSAGTDEWHALENLRKRIDQISGETNEAGERVSSPVPYAAILKADGDRMGALLSRASTADQSRRISRALNRFAASVHATVREHRGHAIYAGGDDILAMVPLARAPQCAKSLAEGFRNALQPAATEMEVPPTESPSLSVGLGVGHIMEPLGALRDRAERAESRAKGDASSAPRNALAITLGMRAGAELCWRAQWSDAAALDALSRFMHGYERKLLPSRAAYDLRAIDQRMAWLRDDRDPVAAGMRAAEVRRMLDRARNVAGDRIPPDLRSLILDRCAARPLAEVADTMLIARWLSARTAFDPEEQA